MRSCFKLFFLFVFLLMPLRLLAEREGPQTGGGGLVALDRGQLILIDFFNYAAPDRDMITRTIKENYFPVYINQALAENSLKNPAVVEQYAEIILRKWSLNGLQTTQMDSQRLMPQVQPLQWKYFEQAETPQQYYHPLYLARDAAVLPAAYYSRYDHMVQISMPVWLRIDFVNRLGLIVHERLRHLQLGLGYSIDDELLQKSTVMMMTCKPNSALSRIVVPQSIRSQRPEVIVQLKQDMNLLTESCLSELRNTSNRP